MLGSEGTEFVGWVDTEVYGSGTVQVIVHSETERNSRPDLLIHGVEVTLAGGALRVEIDRLLALSGISGTAKTLRHTQTPYHYRIAETANLGADARLARYYAT